MVALVADGLEVARPERDVGIDLITFTVNPWKVVPIQMKVATDALVSVHRKHAWQCSGDRSVERLHLRCGGWGVSQQHSRKGGACQDE